MDFSVFRLRFAEHRHECGFLLGSAFAEKMFNYWAHSYLDLHTNIAIALSHVNLDFKQFFVRFVFMDDDDIEYYDEDDDMSYLICPLAITLGLHYLLDLGIPPKYESFLAALVALVWMLIMAPVIRRIYRSHQGY